MEFGAPQAENFDNWPEFPGALGERYPAILTGQKPHQNVRNPKVKNDHSRVNQTVQSERSESVIQVIRVIIQFQADLYPQYFVYGLSPIDSQHS